LPQPPSVDLVREPGVAEKLDRGYLGCVLQLTLLAPDIVEAILDGRQPEGPGLMERLPMEWDEQWMALASWAQLRCLRGGGLEGTVGRKGLI
jgi:hypothetical protein